MTIAVLWFRLYLHVKLEKHATISVFNWIKLCSAARWTETDQTLRERERCVCVRTEQKLIRRWEREVCVRAGKARPHAAVPAILGD